MHCPTCNSISPLRLSDEDRANVSVAVAPPLSLSHSELKVAYVGVIYYGVPAQVSLQEQDPSAG